MTLDAILGKLHTTSGLFASVIGLLSHRPKRSFKTGRQSLTFAGYIRTLLKKKKKRPLTEPDARVLATNKSLHTEFYSSHALRSCTPVARLVRDANHV